MINVKQNTTATFSVSVDDSFVSQSDFGTVTATLNKQNTDTGIDIDCSIVSFDCTRKVLKLQLVIDDVVSGEYKIIIKNNNDIIYRGMIIVETPDKVSGLNGIIIG